MCRGCLASLNKKQFTIKLKKMTVDETNLLNKNSINYEAANSRKGDVGRRFSDEEIKNKARDFCEKWFPKWEKYCEVCKACNCKNNDSCIKCGCQF